MSTLVAENITLSYGASQILHGVSLEARTGEVTCVMGPNGVGKTSLLKAIVGVHPFSGGAIRLGETDLGKLSGHQLARAGVGYVPQGRMIFPRLTVEENLKSGFACLPRNQWRIPDRVFELFPILADFMGRRGGDLSGGQQQQLAIARALITKPRLLILDEPTEGIQPNVIQQIGDVIRALKEEGQMSIILVEQYFDWAQKLSDSFTVMRRGEVIAQTRKDDANIDQLRRLISI
ncbi:urea ABC transporter ATP-binding subunit UrtE [Alphaproteobacteria bacterium]|mgnify:FL=1|jgi:urea transport system ATP-binding protein|nr:urea ABC transporter ATP-binding subunit UrtE [Alphaproteobacteria bacterium]